MRIFLFTLTCIVLYSCQVQNKLQKPTWLVGKWERINEKPDTSTFDFWDEDLTAIGFTLKKSDTIFKEIMSIVSIKDTLHLKVEGVNEKPSLFKFTQQTDTSFVCENPTNEFPKKIHYFKDNDRLKCKISNKTSSVNFIFKKLN